jgi:dipeptidyl aminopeptidase/acylaminoacyl peptidase
MVYSKIFFQAKFILLALIFFFLFTSFWALYRAIKPPKITSTITPKDLSFNYEEVSFTTKDGVTLAGWYVPSRTKTLKTIVLLHGYPADKGDVLPALSFLSRSYNLFLFDFRYLGKSGGGHSTAGAKEVEDLFAAARFLKSRGIEEIGVWGFSMGGAVALMAAKDAPEIKAVVSEASYASLDRLAPTLFRLPILRYPLGYLTGLWARLFLGVDITRVSPAERAKDLTIPILLIHSKNDDVIPFSHALLIQESLKSNLRAEFWFEENLAHGQFGEEYEKRIEEFFEKNL